MANDDEDELDAYWEERDAAHLDELREEVADFRARLAAAARQSEEG